MSVALPRRNHSRADPPRLLLDNSCKMPSLEVDDYGVTPVTTFVDFFDEALDAASSIKPTAAIDPPLEEADLEVVLSRLPETPHTSDSQDTARQRKHHRFAVIETAARGILSNLIVCSPSTLLLNIPAN